MTIQETASTAGPLSWAFHSSEPIVGLDILLGDEERLTLMLCRTIKAISFVEFLCTPEAILRRHMAGYRRKWERLETDDITEWFSVKCFLNDKKKSANQQLNLLRETVVN